MLWQHNHERKRFPVALLKKHIWKMWWAQFPSFKQEKKKSRFKEANFASATSFRSLTTFKNNVSAIMFTTLSGSKVPR